MKIRIAINGFFGREHIRRRLAVRVPRGSSFREVLERADRRLGQPFFATLLKEKRGSPTFLLDGQRLNLLDDLDRKVERDGQLSVLSPLAGG